MGEIKKKVIACSPEILSSQFGAISFIQRFGNTLNYKIGWPITSFELDEPQDLVEWDICQLVQGTADGFPIP